MPLQTPIFCRLPSFQTNAGFLLVTRNDPFVPAAQSFLDQRFWLSLFLIWICKDAILCETVAGSIKLDPDMSVSTGKIQKYHNK